MNESKLRFQFIGDSVDLKLTFIGLNTFVLYVYVTYGLGLGGVEDLVLRINVSEPYA